MNVLQPDIRPPFGTSGSGGGGTSNYIANVLEYGAKGDGTTNDHSAFEAAKATGKPIYVPGGYTFLINTGTMNGFQLNENQSIYGDGEKSILKTTQNGVLLQLHNNNRVTNLKFIGSGKGTVKPQQSLIFNYQNSGSIIEGCTFTDCAGDGSDPYYGGALTICNTQPGEPYYRGLKVNNCNIYDSGVGLYLSKRGEYNAIANVTIRGCNIGHLNTGGNNYLTNCIIVANTIGVQVKADTNSGHGGYTNCSFNHNTSYAFLIDGITEGETFTNCFFYVTGTSKIKDSKGILFYNCQFFDGATELINNTNLQMAGCRYNTANYTITLTSGSNFTMINNESF